MQEDSNIAGQEPFKAGYMTTDARLRLRVYRENGQALGTSEAVILTEEENRLLRGIGYLR